MNENNIPNIQFDALTAGIEPGGLRSKGDINIIICYIATRSKVKLTQKVICDTLVDGAIANYFEVMAAMARILKDEILTEDEEGYLIPSKQCESLLELVEKDLPYTIRKKSIELSAKIAVKEINRKENKVEIEKINQGFNVTMHLTDTDNDFMTLTLKVPSIEEAEIIKENFLDDPISIYNNLINSIFTEKD